MAAKTRGADKSEQPGVQVISIAKAKKQAHPEDEMRLWKFINGVFSQLKHDCPIFGILVIGETGTGKSTLINNLLGKEVAKVGHTMYSQTLFVTPHELSVEGVPVVVYDTPGLEDTGADEDEKKHLEIMESLLARGKIHLVIYCLKMTETRMRKGLIRTFEEYHKIGVPWERTVITLTFADRVEDTTSGKLFEMRQQVKATLTERVGVRSSTSERVKICPTAKDPSIALPTGRPWYVPFWLDVVEVLVPAALVQFLRIHNDSIHMESMPASSHSKPVRVTLVGEDKERFQREVIRLSAHGPVKPEDVAAKQVDLALVDNFVPRMARQWEAIGIQLHQGVLVNNLRLQNHDPRSNCTQVLHEAKESGYLPNYGTLLKILRSDGVCLSQVASELQQAVVVQSEKEREPVGQPADSVSQPSSSPSTPTDDSEDVLLLTPQTVVHDQ